MKSVRRLPFAFKSIVLAAGLVAISISGCKKDDEDPTTPTNPDNEEEVITSVTLTFVNAADPMDTVIANFKDPDGDGGDPPTVFEDIVLDTNTTYNLSITLLDESDPDDVEDITEEIEEEDDEHLFCFDVASANVLITRTDMDDDGLEVGLMSDWETGVASTGTVTITLKHQPGVKDGSCTPGETDIEIAFTTEVVAM